MPPLPAQPYALAHALAYAAMGWPVLALAPGKKRPEPSCCPRGFKNATTDPETIRGWFLAVPDAGVGIRPGPAGLLVLDLDEKPGKPRGADTLAALEAEHGPLPATLVQRTPSGGQAAHLFFALPAGFDRAAIGNRVLAPGIDVRCSEGYVGAEPTRLAAGGYAFDDWDILSGDAPEMAEAPAWLMALLVEQRCAAAPAAPLPSPAAAREFATPHQVAELRSALNALDAGPRDQWVAIGHALKGLGNVGRELWLTWSQTSEKYDPADAARVWASLRPDHTGYPAVFARAQRAGWVNPASRGAALPATVELGTGGAAPVPWRDVDFSGLDHADPSPQEWAWDGLIPAGSLTLLGAHGGAGKSMLALVLGACVALGRPCFGVPTRAAPVMLFSAEDDEGVLQRRLAIVLRGLGVRAADLSGRLRILDATDCAAELGDMISKMEGEVLMPATMQRTPTGDALADALQGLQAPLLIVDNASDTYAGNEIDRKQVRSFVRLLVRLVKPQGGAVLLMSHVDKGTSRGERWGSENYSGSTAWHNSARSRLFLEREKETGVLLLKHEKSNYGPLAKPLRLVWPQDGVPTLDEPATGIVGRIAHDNDTRALLRLIHEFTERGEFISTATTSRTHAGKVMRLAAGFPVRLTDAQVFELLRGAERRNLLARVKYLGPDRHQRERWGVTPAGIEAAGIERPAATAVTCGDIEVTAAGAEPAEPAATAATSPPGGVGGIRAAEGQRISDRNEAEAAT